MALECGTFIPTIVVTDDSLVGLTCSGGITPTTLDQLQSLFDMYSNHLLNTASLVSHIEALGFKWDEIKDRFNIERPDTSWETRGIC